VPERAGRSQLLGAVALLLWTVPLLFFSAGRASIMAHDEGLYATRAREMAETGDWVNPQPSPAKKPPGFTWMVAASYRVLGGPGEFAARLPGVVSAAVSAVLLYAIGGMLFTPLTGWLAAAILGVTPLWLQFARLATPEVPMVALVLLGLWALLKAEADPPRRRLWGFVAGATVGLGFVVRSVMIVLPVVALVPYLVADHRRHRHLANPALFLGVLAGFVPAAVWLWLAWERHGGASVSAPVRLVVRLGTSNWHQHGLLYYVWNIPANAFPWALVAVAGAIVVWRARVRRRRLVLLAMPAVLFAAYSAYGARKPYYVLVLYPFIALLAAVGIEAIDRLCWRRRRVGWALRWTLAAGGAAVVALAFVGQGRGGAGARVAPALFAAGIGLLLLPLIWALRRRAGDGDRRPARWQVGWVIPAWMALAVAGLTGLYGDYSPEVKSFFARPAIADAVRGHPVDFHDVGGKAGVLLRFYTPLHGGHFKRLGEGSTSSLAWVRGRAVARLSRPHQILGEIRGYRLIRWLDRPPAARS
jgi:4-amino-4-deoxy-L-arabinose transferase-like glycosyltransferase